MTQLLERLLIWGSLFLSRQPRGWAFLIHFALQLVIAILASGLEWRIAAKPRTGEVHNFCSPLDPQFPSIMGWERNRHYFILSATIHVPDVAGLRG